MNTSYTIKRHKCLQILFMAGKIKNPKELAAKANVSENVVLDVLHSKQHIMDECRYCDCDSDVALTPAELRNIIAINQILMEWRARAVISGIKLTDDDILLKARSVRALFNMREFIVSTHWLEKFKINYSSSAFQPCKTAKNSLEIDDILHDIKDRLSRSTVRKFLSYLAIEAMTKKLQSKTVKVVSLCTDQKKSKKPVDDIRSDSDVEELKQPVEILDITEDCDDDAEVEEDFAVINEPVEQIDFIGLVTKESCPQEEAIRFADEKVPWKSFEAHLSESGNTTDEIDQEFCSENSYKTVACEKSLEDQLNESSDRLQPATKYTQPVERENSSKINNTEPKMEQVKRLLVKVEDEIISVDGSDDENTKDVKHFRQTSSEDECEDQSKPDVTTRKEDDFVEVLQVIEEDNEIADTGQCEEWEVGMKLFDAGEADHAEHTQAASPAPKQTETSMQNEEVLVPQTSLLSSRTPLHIYRNRKKPISTVKLLNPIKDQNGTPLYTYTNGKRKKPIDTSELLSPIRAYTNRKRKRKKPIDTAELFSPIKDQRGPPLYTYTNRNRRKPIDTSELLSPIRDHEMAYIYLQKLLLFAESQQNTAVREILKQLMIVL